MSSFTTRALTPDTWGDFAAIVERHHGVWGGCWCLAFHVDGKEQGPQRQARKARHVAQGTAQAALVYDGDRCVGWCQFGRPQDLPRIKHARSYQSAGAPLPDWRITCLFVDKAYRGQGVARVAIAGALAQMASLGGGRVESYPEDVEGRKVSPGFLYNGRLEAFEQAGFCRERQLGQHHWVVAREVPKA